MTIEIPYPKKNSHSEIESELYHALRQLKYDVHLEVPTPAYNRHKCRPDLVVFKNQKAICIIECKSWSKSYLRNQKYQKTKNSRQLTRYREHFGLPVFVCGCLASIVPAIHFVKACFDHSP